MKNPFIQLTTPSGEPVYINVHHIDEVIEPQDRTPGDEGVRGCTVLVVGHDHDGSVREVKESIANVMALIRSVYE